MIGVQNGANQEALGTEVSKQADEHDRVSRTPRDVGSGLSNDRDRSFYRSGGKRRREVLRHVPV
jgi:hypothetical protein